MGMLHGDRNDAPHGYYEKADFNSSPKYDDKELIESFTNIDSNNSNKYFNMNLLLKSLLFGCLFYLLLDLQAPIVKMLSFKLNKENQLCLLGTVFTLLHYLLSMII